MRALLRPISILVVSSIGAIVLHPIFWIGSILLALDTYSRYKDILYYQQFEGSTSLYKYLQPSWCERGIAEALWPNAKYYYYNRGYRWWHILPDGSPGVFFKLNFWKAVVRPNRLGYTKSKHT